MQVDDLAHELLATDIGMQAVDGKRGIEDGMCLVVEIGLEIDEVGLCFDVSVDVVHLRVPFRVSVRVEGELDVLRMNRHERQEDRADVVLFTERFDAREVADDVVRGNRRIAQTVCAREDQEVFGVHRYDVLLEARERRLARVAAAAEIHGGEVEVRAIAVLECRGRVRDGAAAMRDTVAKHRGFDVLMLWHDEMRSFGIMADRVAFCVECAHAPVVVACVGTRVLIIAVRGGIDDAAPDAVGRWLRTAFFVRRLRHELDFIMRDTMQRNPAVDGIDGHLGPRHVVKIIEQRCIRRILCPVDDERFGF